MNFTTKIYADSISLGISVAQDIYYRFSAKGSNTFLLGCPGGRSPKPIYDALARIFANNQSDISRLHIVMMDDYLEPCGDGYDHVPADAHFSCRRFAREDIQSVLNAGVPAAHRIPDELIWFPDPADPAAYDDKISSAGGIDFFILASGASDGHVAFNPPGSPVNSRSRIVDLADKTRRDNLSTFPDFPSIDAVPTKGVTVGIATIATQSRAGALVLWGQDKHGAFQRLRTGQGYEPDWPATVFRLIPDAALHCDQAAYGGCATA